jgi:hypothetical protein
LTTTLDDVFVNTKTDDEKIDGITKAAAARFVPFALRIHSKRLLRMMLDDILQPTTHKYARRACAREVMMWQLADTYSRGDEETKQLVSEVCKRLISDADPIIGRTFLDRSTILVNTNRSLFDDIVRIAKGSPDRLTVDRAQNLEKHAQSR